MYGRKHGEGRVEEDGTTICERRGGRRETMAGCIVPGRWRTAQDLGLALDAIVQCLKKERSERKSWHTTARVDPVIRLGGGGKPSYPPWCA